MITLPEPDATSAAAAQIGAAAPPDPVAAAPHRYTPADVARTYGVDPAEGLSARAASASMPARS